jgi:uncharacterized protein (TIGR03790 family)
VKSIQSFVRRAVSGGLVFLALFAAAPAWALDPSQILLITNKNSPDSQRLAALYCQLRGVPVDQTVALDLPNAEEMPFLTYEQNVMGPLRQYLADHQLQSKIKCLLTFYGVPFRIAARVNTEADLQEQAELKDLRSATAQEFADQARSIESNAAELDPNFKPGRGDTPEALDARSKAAMIDIVSKIPAIADPEQQRAQRGRLWEDVETINGRSAIDNAEHGQPGPLHDQVMEARRQIDTLGVQRWDRQARSDLRHWTELNLGLVGLLRLLDAQIQYFDTADTASATDSELSLLMWDYYPRPGRLPNPMKIDFMGRLQPTMMTMRLDAPDPATVEKMMRTSIAVEKTGLQGIVAIDARGLQPIDDKGQLNTYGEFDETLRDLAYMLRLKTNLKIKLGNEDIVFPPHTVKNVALYVGWYSLQKYIPGCDFNPGAVGFHVASFELTTLHAPTTEWVSGLLHDGVVATLGAVAEPYLDSFPKPDDFFPLLLTGKLTLAEVYWKTTPYTSWMISFIGDPLYTPFKNDPAMKIEDLPPGLRRAFQ